MSKFADDALSAASLFTIRLKGIYEPWYCASTHGGFMLKAALQDPLPPQDFMQNKYIMHKVLERENGPWTERRVRRKA